MAVADINNPEAIKESNKQIVSYNKEIEAAIASNKKELLKAKTPNSKQQITSEIKQLETTKKENNQLLASNNKQIQTLNTEIAKNNSPVTSANEKSINLNPINANNGADALKNLDELNNQLSTNDNSNFSLVLKFIILEFFALCFSFNIANAFELISTPNVLAL